MATVQQSLVPVSTQIQQWETTMKAELQAFFAAIPELETLTNQVNALIAQAEPLKVSISDNDQCREATELAQSLKTIDEQYEEITTPRTQQAHKFHKALVEIDKQYRSKGQQTAAALKVAIGAYLREQERIRQENEARMAAEAKRQQDEAAQREAERLAAEGNMEEAEQVLQEAIEAPTPVIIAPKSVPAIAGLSMRANWTWEFDEAALAKASDADLRKLFGFLSIGTDAKGRKQELSTSGITAFVKSAKKNATKTIPCIKAWDAASTIIK